MVRALIGISLTLMLSTCGLNALPCNVGPFKPDPGAAQRFTRGEKEQVVVINEAGETFCGWPAGGA